MPELLSKSENILDMKVIGKSASIIAKSDYLNKKEILNLPGIREAEEVEFDLEEAIVSLMKGD